MNIDETDALFDDESVDRDENPTEELGEPTAEGQLKFNENDNSYEYDISSDDPDYDHPDPYKTAAKNGEDMNSTYDEANPFDTSDEYIPNETLETDVDQLGMHIDDGKIVELDPTDAALAHTPEDDRDDLDEEGYPKNDKA